MNEFPSFVAFDSGIGGLSALPHIIKKYSPLKIVYFGDLANLPYGTKSKARIRELTEQNLTRLMNEFSPQAPSLGLIACNTASALAMDVGIEVGRRFKRPVLGVLDACCTHALKHSPRRVVVLATKGTVNSGAYSKKLRELKFEGEIVEQACPLFVPLVESGLTEGPAVEWIVKNYLDAVVRANDTVILGCTHYPYLREVLLKLYPTLRLVDASEALVDYPEFKTLSAAQQNQSQPSELELIFSDDSVSREDILSVLRLLKIDNYVKWSFRVIAPGS